MILGIQLNILKGFGSSSVAGSVFLGSPRNSPVDLLFSDTVQDLKEIDGGGVH